ncbi:MAG: S-layer homology domain-containing protein [Lachnospiraceae bacterium]|nr:S-layer homology domain-containing protein [Lachnospiraceae bacterium]
MAIIFTMCLAASITTDPSPGPLHITSGTSATTFSPHRTITRAEALTFLYIIKGPQA